MSKEVDIKQEVINKRCGVYHFSKDSIGALEDKLKEIKEEGLFDKYDMSYTWREDDDYIIFILHKSLDFIR